MFQHLDFSAYPIFHFPPARVSDLVKAFHLSENPTSEHSQTYDFSHVSTFPEAHSINIRPHSAAFSTAYHIPHRLFSTYQHYLQLNVAIISHCRPHTILLLKIASQKFQKGFSNCWIRDDFTSDIALLPPAPLPQSKNPRFLFDDCSQTRFYLTCDSNLVSPVPTDI